MSATVEGDLIQGFRQHESWLRTALHSRLGSQDEVDEVMQEVALAAAHQAAKNQQVDRVGAWLYRVALRQVMLFRRKAGRRRKLIQSAQHQLNVNGSPSTCPLQFLLSQERQQIVQQAIGKMCELDRQLLMLKYVEGMSYGQIADRLGVTASAVQSRLHRARALMRHRLNSTSHDWAVP